MNKISNIKWNMTSDEIIDRANEVINKSIKINDIYTKLIEIIKFNEKNQILDDIDIIFIDKLILNFKRNGIELTNNNKKLLLKINQEIAKLENGILELIHNSENDYITINIE